MLYEDNEGNLLLDEEVKELSPRDQQRRGIRLVAI